jgi:5-methylcytosine-specific restriction endonuclease McrA
MTLNGGEAAAESPALPAALPAPPVVQPTVHPRVTPLSPKRYAIQFTMDEATYDLLCKAQDLLGHQLAPGDVAEIVGRALKAYVAQLERTKFAATDRPQAGRRPTASGSRHIPARVKRAVYKRDGGQCTFVSESGHRCEARSDLEFDHVKEFARGGQATVDDVRLRCRDHNQYTAEQTFGAGFMKAKRDDAKAAAARRKAERERQSRPQPQPQPPVAAGAPV